jgi:transcriptional regulator with XRE-family HTH domain
MTTRGQRLREERLRLDLSQAKLGAACGVCRATQINYERDARSPDAEYLASAHYAGVDVLYVITGQRAPALPAATAPAPAASAPSRPSFFARLLACLRGH